MAIFQRCHYTHNTRGRPLAEMLCIQYHLCPFAVRPFFVIVLFVCLKERGRTANGQRLFWPGPSPCVVYSIPGYNDISGDLQSDHSP